MRVDNSRSLALSSLILLSFFFYGNLVLNSINLIPIGIKCYSFINFRAKLPRKIVQNASAAQWKFRGTSAKKLIQ